MKLKLKEFQEEAVAKLVRYIRSAAKDSKSGDNQAVSLASTTGSGKTVMLTSAIELVLQGDDDAAPIRRVRDAPDEPGLLETVDHASDRPGGEPRELGQTARTLRIKTSPPTGM